MVMNPASRNATESGLAFKDAEGLRYLEQARHRRFDF
jgi:hypothetical protein